ncbi:MAG TPA: ABC transporter substrate-binding protein [Candidatus Lustribacter sp.]|nr:ABC transporter substrate-binding protein [Candidatus Lustribacter sp.]
MQSMRRSNALALIAGGAFAAAGVPAIAQSEGTSVRMASMSIDAMGESYYGVDRGFFRDNGISPALTTMTNSSAIVQSVLAGDLDAGMTNTVQLAVAVARNVPVQMIAPASLYSSRDNTQGLAVAKNSPYTSAKDLIGGTIAVSALADFNQLGISAWLDHNGVSPSSVHWVELRFSEMGQALARGTVQAAQIAEPSMSAAVKAGDVRQFADVYSAIAPEFATIVWFSSKTWIQANPDALKKLRSGIFATARWANSHYPESAEILAKAAKVDVATVSAGRRVYFATTNDPKFVVGPLAAAAKYGITSRLVTPAEYMAP